MRHRVCIFAGLGLFLFTSSRAENLQMALAAAADFSAVYPFDKIPADIRGIVAIIDFGTAKPKTLVASYFKMGDNAGAPDDKIAEQEQAVGDNQHLVLRYTAARDWTPGKYRLVVLIDGHPWQSAQWEVVPPLPEPILGSAEDIMPLSIGMVWPMAFTSWSSPGVRVTLPGAERDANGVYHMSAAISIPDTGPDGVRIRHTRNGNLAEEELWHLGPSGIEVIGRLAAAKPLRVDPPFPIVPFPLPGPEKSWDWRSGEEGHWKFRGWGPVQLRGPNGEQPGYVIVMEQPTAARTISRERDIIPGLGTSREIFVDQTGSGVTLFHQEYVLTGTPNVTVPEGPPGSGKQ